MTGQRVAWSCAGLVMIVGAGLLASLTVVYVLSAEYAESAWRELLLVTPLAVMVVGGAFVIRRAMWATNPITAIVPLGIAVLAALVWLAAAPL